MLHPLVSIIIVNYNGKDYLETCFHSLMSNSYKNYEIILLDNNSSDGSLEFISEYYPTVIIKKLDKNYGFAKPNNLGANMAKGDYILFLNNDTKVDPNFLTELVSAAINKNADICQSLLLKLDGTIDSAGDFIDKYGRAYSSKIIPKDISFILSAKGASMLIRKSIFYELEGFDEDFFASFEDVDLGWRAWITGHNVVVVPNSIVYHIGGATIKTRKNEILFHAIKNSLSLRITNFEIYYTIRSLLVLFFVSVTRKTFGFSVINDPEEGPPLPGYKTILKGIGWTLNNFKTLMKKRRIVNVKRVNSTNQLMKMNLITD